MTDDGKIGVSESGIVIAYRRFISDSAPGLIFLASLIIIYNPYDILYDTNEFSNQTRIALYVLLILISTPLGLALNAASYFFFDALVHYFERKIFINSLFNNNWLINFANRYLPGVIAGAVCAFFQTGVVDEFVWDKCKKRGCIDMWCKDKDMYRCYDECYKSGNLFTWDNISEDDKERLIKFLDWKYGIDWLEYSEIKKINDAICLCNKYNSKKSLALTSENDKVVLKIDGIKKELDDVRIEGSQAILYNSNYKDKQVDDFYRFTNCVAEMMRMHRRNDFDIHGHEVGAHTFYRNLAFISLSILVIDLLVSGGLLGTKFQTILVFNYIPFIYIWLFLMAVSSFVDLRLVLIEAFFLLVGYYKIIPLFNYSLPSIYIWLVLMAELFLFFSTFACYYYHLAFLSDAYSLSKKRSS